MKTLDLTSLKNSDIKYKINPYPDGQKDITLLTKLNEVISEMNLSNFIHIQIKSRLNNMEDLGLIICANQALKNLKMEKLEAKVHLYTPWIMGLRSDRLFQEGGVRYIKDVLAPMINSQGFESVTCYDAHSDVAQNCINNLKIIDNKQLAVYALHEIRPEGIGFDNYRDNNMVLISPDGGALNKIYKVADAIGYKGEVICCSKSRDVDGKLSKTFVPIDSSNQLKKDFIIIDDICDGGTTFINIAKAIKEKGSKFDLSPKIYLIVTHSILSKGLMELYKYFDGIYTTNSYRDFSNFSEVGWDKTKLKQLNVF